MVYVIAIGLCWECFFVCPRGVECIRRKLQLIRGLPFLNLELKVGFEPFVCLYDCLYVSFFVYLFFFLFFF